MRIDVFTIFPGYFDGPLSTALLGRARQRGLLEVRLHDPRDWTTDRHRAVDDAPFGGGAGMVMIPEPLFAAVEASDPPRPLWLLSAAGRRFDQALARELATAGVRGAPGGDRVRGAPGGDSAGSARAGNDWGFSLVCGRYEGVDQRVADHLCDGELSVGDYVLPGGEAAALVVIEAVARLVPEVMGNEASAGEESFTEGLVEYPQYTRPATFRGWDVPEVLRSGDHARIARWRRAEALRRTAAQRPELLEWRGLSDEERALLEESPPQ